VHKTPSISPPEVFALISYPACLWACWHMYIHTKINPDTNSDLLWASCGGGGGTFGIVTSMEVKIHTLPNGGTLNGFVVRAL